MISTLSMLLLASSPTADVPVVPMPTPVKMAFGADGKAKEKAADYDTKKVCKKFPPPTGSRLGPRKVCRTQAQWDSEAREKDKEMDRMQGRWSHQGN